MTYAPGQTDVCKCGHLRRQHVSQGATRPVIAIQNGYVDMECVHNWHDILTPERRASRLGFQDGSCHCTGFVKD